VEWAAYPREKKVSAAAAQLKVRPEYPAVPGTVPVLGFGYWSTGQTAHAPPKLPEQVPQLKPVRPLPAASARTLTISIESFCSEAPFILSQTAPSRRCIEKNSFSTLSDAQTVLFGASKPTGLD
jgi:hypothetical protein